MSMTKNPTIFKYCLGGSSLKTVEHHPYLGVELSSSLDCGCHISNIVGKANQSLGFIRRNLSGCPKFVKEKAYATIVRPRLEYASSLWDPHYHKHINDIEAIQWRAARFVCSCYSNELRTASNLLHDLKWPSLEKRRKIARLILFFKIINSLVEVDLPDKLFQKPVRCTRSSHPKRFINLHSITNTYKFSFITRTLKEWNSLNNDSLHAPSLEKFKELINEDATI